MLVQMIEEGKLQPWKVVSHKLPLSEAPEGYAKFDSKEFNKVLIFAVVLLAYWQLLAGDLIAPVAISDGKLASALW